jgi:hypothetical protein
MLIYYSSHIRIYSLYIQSCIFLSSPHMKEQGGAPILLEHVEGANLVQGHSWHVCTRCRGLYLLQGYVHHELIRVWNPVCVFPRWFLTTCTNRRCVFPVIWPWKKAGWGRSSCKWSWTVVLFNVNLPVIWPSKLLWANLQNSLVQILQSLWFFQGTPNCFMHALRYIQPIYIRV